jgi:thymidine phosphorylase
LILPQEIIAGKRDRQALTPDEIGAIVRGLVDGGIGDAQAGAFAMAVVLNGMDEAETVALTRAMADSGERLAWPNLAGPVLDKHSTGGIGDKASLILAPLLAAAGAFVPMISGRGLGHTGGTLDKLESFLGLDTRPSLHAFQRIVREVGCAIVGPTDDIAPADRRLYAIRDVTATVESRPLIVASILSKKLAAGASGLVMDVKVGNGAFMTTLGEARALGRAIADVANAAGLPTRAIVTDMNQCLGETAGNALEVAEAVAFLKDEARDPRLAAVVFALAADLLRLGGLESSLSGLARLISDGSAAECFARMVAAQGGPGDALSAKALTHAKAPFVVPVPAPEGGHVAAVATRELGLAVIALGGGRTDHGSAIDHAVGLAKVSGVGRAVQAGEPLALVHGRDQDRTRAIASRLATAFTVTPDVVEPTHPIVERL